MQQHPFSDHFFVSQFRHSHSVSAFSQVFAKRFIISYSSGKAESLCFSRIVSPRGPQTSHNCNFLNRFYTDESRQRYKVLVLKPSHSDLGCLGSLCWVGFFLFGRARIRACDRQAGYIVSLTAGYHCLRSRLKHLANGLFSMSFFVYAWVLFGRFRLLNLALSFLIMVEKSWKNNRWNRSHCFNTKLGFLLCWHSCKKSAILFCTSGHLNAPESLTDVIVQVRIALSTSFDHQVRVYREVLLIESRRR